MKGGFEVIEYFAGSARISQLSEFIGLKTAAVDIDYSPAKFGKRSPMDLNSSAGLVLGIKLILRGQFERLVCFFATCCSSWVPINRATGQRDLCCPLGNESVPSCRRANKLVSRSLA